MRFEVMPTAAVAATIVALGAAGCGGSTNVKNAGDASPVAPTAAAIDAMVTADCEQPAIPLNQYPHSNIDTPYNNTIGSDGVEFTGTESAVSAEVAQHVGKNTASLAIIWTIINQANTNISVVDASKNATHQLQDFYNNPSDRAAKCADVLRAILKAPPTTWPDKYQSPTGKIFTYKPIIDGSNSLTGINSVIGPDTGPMNVYTIEPVAGSNNQTLQGQIAREWGITPDGAIVQTDYETGQITISPNGSPVSVKPNGKNPVSNKNLSTTGGGKNVSVTVTGGFMGNSNGGGGSSSRGNSPQNRLGPSPHGPKEGKPNKPHPSPSGGNTTSTNTNTGTTPTGSTETSTTNTGTTSTGTTETTTTTTTTGTTGTTGTTTGTKGAPGNCVPNPPYVICP